VGTGDAAVKLSLDWKGVPVRSTTHTLRVLEPAGGKTLPVSPRLVRSLPHPDRTASVWRVAFTPRGQLFTAGYPSGVVQIWGPVSGRELRRVESPRGYRGSADYALTPADFSRLYVPIDGRKVVRDPDAKKPIRIAYEGKVLVWDLATGKSLPDIRPRPGRGVIAAYVSPDGKRVITVERAGYVAGSDPPADLVRMYDTAGGRSWDLGEGYGMATFSADGSRVYLSRMPNRTASGVLLVLDKEGKELATLARLKDNGLTWPVLSPDGKRLVVEASKRRINEPGTLKVFDLPSGKEIASFPSGGDFPFMVPAFSPDGRLVAASDYNGQVTIWDVEKKKVLRKQKFEGKGMGLSLAFSPDGRRLAVPARVKTDNDRARDPDPLDVPQPRVYLFDLTRDGPPEEMVCPHGWTGGLAFSADGKTLAVGGAGAVHLFDVAKK
jgi:WD40 repeat protein